MSWNYKFHNPESLYFVSFAVIVWLDVFTRRQYKDLLLESMSYSQQYKGMEIFAWWIMTNHAHIVFCRIGTVKPEIVLGDLKRYTIKKIVSAIIENPQESRKEWLLNLFQKEQHRAVQRWTDIISGGTTIDLLSSRTTKWLIRRLTTFITIL